MGIDELIRSALEQQADRAPAPERTRAALPARLRSRRHRRLAATLGVAAVTAAVLVVVPILVRSEQSKTAVGSPTTAAPTGAPATVGYGMDYRPTWLPAGLVEQEREVDTAGPHTGFRSRYWGATSMLPMPMMPTYRYVWLALYPTSDTDELTGKPRAYPPGHPIDINGAAATIADKPNRYTEVYWPITASTVIVVRVGYDVPDASDAATRVARSVVADPTSRLEAPLKLGWLPAQVGNHPLLPNRAAVLRGDTTNQWELRALFGYRQSTSYVSVGTYRAPMEGGTPVSARGRAGLVVPPHPGGKYDNTPGMLQVDLDGGLVLTIVAAIIGGETNSPPQLTVADMVRIADSVEIVSIPDVSWIGTRP